MVENQETDFDLDCLHIAGSEVSGETKDRLTSGRAVINAMGIGKDTLDSPLTDRGLFTLDRIAWEVDYRETFNNLDKVTEGS